MMQSEYDQYIGLYPKAVPAEKCNAIISYFEEMVEIQKSYNRQDAEGVSRFLKKDDSVNAGMPKIQDFSYQLTLAGRDPTRDIISEELAQCMEDYIETYDILKTMSIMPLYHKIQKTLPSGGYHIWHTEQGEGANMRRVLVYTLYLNDVEEGGETEFLYQSKRYPARKGDICIFPAHFTHPHRGNPPLSGEKYIMTGWIESVDLPDKMQMIPT